MGTVTIYTLGDLSTFYAVLNGVAMLFNDSMMSGGGGIGLGYAAGMGLLITFIFVMIKGVLKSQMELHVVLILVIVYGALFIPKTRVQLEDMYSGTVAAVDNVPVGIAYPGALISAITSSIAEKIETAMSTVDGNYITQSTQGFVNPLRLLLSMRETNKSGLTKTDPFLAATLSAFVKDCVIGAGTYNAKDYKNSNDPVQWLIDHHGNGLTTYYSASYPTGTGATCSEVASTGIGGRTVMQDAIDYVNTGINEQLNSAMPNKAPPNTNIPGKWSSADVQDVHQRLIGPILGAAQDAQKAMITLTTANLINDSMNCAGSSTSNAEYVQCTVLLTQAMEQYKTDATAAGSLFSKVMIPSMNVLLLLFYAFAPFIAIFIMMAGWHGLNVLFKYLLFGAWTQTWLPFAAVINFIIQVQFRDEMNRIGDAGGGITPANVNSFYEIASLKLAIASDMLAATPLITLALLSGSIYGLVSVAQRMGGRDYTDEKIASPNVVSNGAAMQVGARYSSKGFAEWDQSKGFGRTGYEAFDPTISVGKLSTSARQAAATEATTASQTFSKATSAGEMWTDSKTKTSQDMQGFTKTWMQGNTVMNSAVDTITKAVIGNKTNTGSTSKVVQEAVEASAASGFDVNVIAAKIRAMASSATGTTKTELESIAQSTTDSSAHSKTVSDTVTNQVSKTDVQQQISAFQQGKTNSTGVALSDMASKVQQSTRTLQQVDSQSASVNAQQTLKYSDIAANAEQGQLQGLADKHGITDKDIVKEQEKMKAYAGNEPVSRGMAIVSALQNKPTAEAQADLLGVVASMASVRVPGQPGAGAAQADGVQGRVDQNIAATEEKTAAATGINVPEGDGPGVHRQQPAQGTGEAKADGHQQQPPVLKKNKAGGARPAAKAEMHSDNHAPGEAEQRGQPNGFAAAPTATGPAQNPQAGNAAPDAQHHKPDTSTNGKGHTEPHGRAAAPRDVDQHRQHSEASAAATANGAAQNHPAGTADGQPPARTAAPRGPAATRQNRGEKTAEGHAENQSGHPMAKGPAAGGHGEHPSTGNGSRAPAGHNRGADAAHENEKPGAWGLTSKDNGRPATAEPAWKAHDAAPAKSSPEPKQDQAPKQDRTTKPAPAKEDAQKPAHAEKAAPAAPPKQEPREVASPAQRAEPPAQRNEPPASAPAPSVLDPKPPGVSHDEWFKRGSQVVNEHSEERTEQLKKGAAQNMSGQADTVADIATNAVTGLASEHPVGAGFAVLGGAFSNAYQSVSKAALKSGVNPGAARMMAAQSGLRFAGGIGMGASIGYLAGTLAYKGSEWAAEKADGLTGGHGATDFVYGAQNRVGRIVATGVSYLPGSIGDEAEETLRRERDAENPQSRRMPSGGSRRER